ncbi:hypothetical protein RP20_CCG009953 [Aedes albopictus]|nr:hypothetical protein RP20_CCG009953 [Aedes albopictus]
MPNQQRIKPSLNLIHPCSSPLSIIALDMLIEFLAHPLTNHYGSGTLSTWKQRLHPRDLLSQDASMLLSISSPLPIDVVEKAQPNYL